MIERIFPMKNARHLHGIARRALRRIAREFAEWTFVLVSVEYQFAFDRNLGMRGYLDRTCDTVHNLQRLAEEASRHFIFVGADRPLPKTGTDGDQGMTPGETMHSGRRFPDPSQ